ncbi:MAG: ABC transporter permease [Lachnospiraceae bacterium]
MKFRMLWYEIKYVCRMRGLLFWSLLLPVLLSTLFSLTLQAVYERPETDKIKAGIVYRKGYEVRSDFTADHAAVETDIMGAEQAEEYLRNGTIDGYFIIGEECRLVVLDNGYEQRLLKSCLDEYVRLQKADAALGSRYLYLGRSSSGTQIGEKNNAEIFSVVSHYDAILATACICAAFSGLLIVSDVCHPAQSAVALRYLTAPVHRFSPLIRHFLVAWPLQSLFVTAAYFYMQWILGIPFHMKLGYVLLIHLTGVLVGMLFGVFAGLVSRLPLSAKLGIAAAVIIVFAYFSGLMDIHVRASVQENIPFLHFINPCVLLTDAYYAVHQWDPAALFRSLSALLSIGLLCVLLMILYEGEREHETA